MKIFNLPLVLFVSFFAIVSTAAAQKSQSGDGSRHEWGLGAGIGTIQEFASLIGEGLSSGVSGQDLDKSSGTGAYTLSYEYFTGQRFSFGGSATYEAMSTTYKNPALKVKWNMAALMARCKFRYISRPGFDLYSHLALGAAGFFAGSYDTNVLPAFQVSPVGVRFGKSFGVYAEVGFGYEGLVKAGVSYRF